MRKVTFSPSSARSPCWPFRSRLPGPPLSRPTGAHWTIELPNPFDVEVLNRTLSFNARKDADGSATGPMRRQGASTVSWVFADPGSRGSRGG